MSMRDFSALYDYKLVVINLCNEVLNQQFMSTVPLEGIGPSVYRLEGGCFIR
jgi:hypothetical protein